MRVVAIVSAFNEEDIIGQVVEDLIRQHVSVYMLDNRSTDRTAAEVAPFLGRGVIRIEQFPADGDPGGAFYEWERILQRKAEIAQTLDADWFLHHDADEFREGPWDDLDLTAAIERVDRSGYNAIDFEVLNFWPTRDLDSGEDVRQAFTHYEAGGTWDKIQVRCWKKTEHRVDLASTGGHEAIFPNRHIFPIRFILRHYPIRSQAHGQRKVFEERRPRFIEEERKRGWHIQYKRFEPGGSFLKDPTTLVPYDPERIRIYLSVHNRRVEELQALPESDQRFSEQAHRYEARLEQELDARNRDLERQQHDLDARNREIERLQRDLDARNHQTMALESELDVQNRRCQALDSELDARNHAFMMVERDLDTANHRLADLEGKLEATRSSWVRRLRSRFTGR